MRVRTAAVMLGLLASPLFAMAKLPIEFNTVEGWEPLPHWVPNRARKPRASAQDGVAHFSVLEPGKGMKWRLHVAPVPASHMGYIVVRYRAQNIDRSAGYFLWGFDASEGGHTIVPVDAVVADGRWHMLAVDVWGAGVEGAVRGLALEVQAGKLGTASVWLDYIRFADRVPAGAKVIAKAQRKVVTWQEDFDSLEGWSARPKWIRTADPSASLTVDHGAVRMSVPTDGRGMKWSKRFAKPVDLTGMRFVAIRYRAEHIEPHADYFVWLGSEVGGMPSKAAHLIRQADVEDDGQWHVFIATLKEPVKVAEMAIQVRAAAPNARAWIDYVRFSNRAPLIAVGDLVAYALGFEKSRLKADHAAMVDLSAAANASIRPRLRALGLSDWFPGGKLTVDGIPFVLPSAKHDVVATPPGEMKPISIPIGQRARELYLLMASVLPPKDYTGISRGRPFHKFDQPERFIVRVVYRDGVTDEQFPVHVRKGRHQVVRGVGVYCLPNLRDVPVAHVALECAMPGASMMVAAVTANNGEAVTPEPRLLALPQPIAQRAIARHKPRLQIRPGGFDIDTSTLRAQFDTTKGVTLAALRNKCLVPRQQQLVKLASGSFFELGVGDTVLTSDQLGVSHVRMDANRIVLDVDARPRVPLAGTLRIGASDAGELVMGLDVRNVSDKVVLPVVNFPTFSRVVLGDVPNTWYFYARQGGIINNTPTRQRWPYSGRYPLQVTGLFNPQLGGGIYMVIRDLTDIYKYYVTDKNAEGVDWRIEYAPREYQPGERIEVADTALCGNTGDWRAQFAAYKRWTSTWYKALAPRKDWFRDVYSYRQFFIRHGGLYDFETKQYHGLDLVAKDREFFGSIDYLHIFDFSHSETYGRTGDYTHYDEIGGREKLAAAIARVQKAGVRVGLYFEGYLIDERSLWGRQHVDKCHIIRHDGSPLLWRPDSTEHMMCSAYPLWQDYLAGVFRRVAGELKPDGMYIDQHGFGNEGKTCYSRKHGHPVPWPPIRGERALGRKIRQAIPPHIVTLTEDTPTDVNSQVQDGALGYSVAFNDPVLAPHRVDLFRFAFPDFKVIQLVSYNSFVRGNWHLLKFPFFNAEAWWLHNPVPVGFGPPAHAFLRKAYRILHAHAATFRTMEPKPLVPTAAPLVYANEFPGNGETVWTLYNAGFRTHRGPVLRVKHVEGATYRDLWNGVALKPQVKGGWAVLSVELGPHDVGCIVRENR